MTTGYNYDPTLSNDTSLVRFHVGDNHEEGHFLDDGEIGYFLTSTGSVGGAVIACIRYIITQLSTPNFGEDWLNVNYGEARTGYEKLLADKMVEFGIQTATATASVTYLHRADSYENKDASDNLEADEEEPYDRPTGLPSAVEDFAEDS